MKEELIRVEDGRFRRDEGEYRFEISIARGECIGIYVDDHFTSGTAYLDVFKGVSRMEGGRAFARGRRVGALELERWIQHATRIVDRHRFDSRELTVRDFILALDRDVDHHRRWAAARLKSPETEEMLERMEESTEQILVVLGKDTATGDFSSTCFISGSRKTVNKVFEKKERIDEKEDTQISSFIDTNHHKVVCEEEENSLYYRKNISWMLIISISALMLLYFIYKKRRILF